MSADTAAPLPNEWKPSFNPWLIAVSIMLATFMEVLDTSVANVSLPHIAGNLSASTDEATWVLTSYLLSNAIILPATNWLGQVFGRKRFLIGCIILFTFASALCGIAGSLGFLIIARVLQGAAGGALQPISQAVLMESFPPAKRGMAMAVFTMGIVVAPILGPIIGGWLTYNYSWRWAFYINLPIGFLAAVLCRAFLEDPPYLKRSSAANIDYLGFGLLGIWLASLQIMLDKGQELDWFGSKMIVWCAVIASAGFIAFIVRELVTAHPIVDLRILKNRNFAIGNVLMLLIGALLYATIAILPLFMQNLLHNIGGSIGIASITTLVTRQAQASQANLVWHMSAFNSNFQQKLAHLQSALASNTGNWAATKKSLAVLYGILQQQSSLLSYVYGFRFCVLVCLVCAALALLFKKVGKPIGPVAAH